MFLLLMLLTFIWISPGLASATTYYVAKTGSNSYSCTQAQSASTPKLTINSGIDCLSGGDTLIIKSGTYAEGINDTIPAGTSTAARTTIRASAGDTVTIRPAAGVGPGSLHGVYITKSYVALHDLIIDGVNVVLTFRLNGTATGNLLQNSEVKSIRKTGGGNCITIQGSVRNSTLINNKIHDCGDPSSRLEHGVYLWNTGHLVERNEIYNTTGHGIHAYNTASSVSDNIIRYNYIHDNVSRGILIGSGDNNIAHHNIIVDNGQEGINIGFNSPTNNQAYNNTIYSNAKCIEIKSGATGAKVKNNLCLSNGNNTILNSGTSSVVAKNLLSTDLTLLVDPNNNRFNPREGAALIDVGENIANFSAGKFLGLAPDQGAIEFANNTGTVSAPTAPTAPTFLRVTP